MLASTFTVYLEWGTDQSSFLIEAEWTVFKKITSTPLEVLHPFTVLPLIGQIWLLMLILKTSYRNWQYYVSIGLLASLIGMISLSGILSINLWTIISVTPFWVLSGWIFLTIKSKKESKSQQSNKM